MAPKIPKSGRSRRVALTEQLVDTLFDVLAERQRQRIANGWPDTPEWVFCSQSGSAPDPSNIARVWARVRRRAQKQGVRPLSMHSCRHSWATWALQAGKNIRWVADQLGHSDPSITLNHYAHAMPEDEAGLSFAELGGARRRNTAKADDVVVNEARNYAESMARREGFDDLLRSLVESATAEIHVARLWLTMGRREWHAGRDSRAAEGCDVSRP